MYYHVLIEANIGSEKKELLEMDIRKEEEVIKDMVLPYLEEREFQFDGYFVTRKDIGRFVIKVTEKSLREHAKYENDNMPRGLIMYVEPKDIIADDKYTSDITKVIFTNVKKELDIKTTEDNTQNTVDKIDRTKVFIVHGHDELAQSKAARFIEKLGFTPIILHEQVNNGKTIIEKIESYSNVGFGIVLYTPCDIGAKNESDPKLKKRARQNVVFEHGYLIGKIGRSNVCALVKDDLETPNDISGVVYVTMDAHDAWQNKVAKEMQESGYNIDMNKL